MDGRKYGFHIRSISIRLFYYFFHFSNFAYIFFFLLHSFCNLFVISLYCLVFTSYHPNAQRICKSLRFSSCVLCTNCPPSSSSSFALSLLVLFFSSGSWASPVTSQDDVDNMQAYKIVFDNFEMVQLVSKLTYVLSCSNICFRMLNFKTSKWNCTNKRDEKGRNKTCVFQPFTYIIVHHPKANSEMAQRKNKRKYIDKTI